MSITPTVEEALAYADGYVDCLKEVKEADIATLIAERDSLSAQLSCERALKEHAEKQLDEARAALNGNDVRIFSLRTEDETTFYTDELERDLMAKAAVNNGKTAFKDTMIVTPTATGIARKLNMLFERKGAGI